MKCLDEYIRAREASDYPLISRLERELSHLAIPFQKQFIEEFFSRAKSNKRIRPINYSNILDQLADTTSYHERLTQLYEESDELHLAVDSAKKAGNIPEAIRIRKKKIDQEIAGEHLEEEPNPLRESLDFLIYEVDMKNVPLQREYDKEVIKYLRQKADELELSSSEALFNFLSTREIRKRPRKLRTIPEKLDYLKERSNSFYGHRTSSHNFPTIVSEGLLCEVMREAKGIPRISDWPYTKYPHMLCFNEGDDKSLIFGDEITPEIVRNHYDEIVYPGLLLPEEILAMNVYQGDVSILLDLQRKHLKEPEKYGIPLITGSGKIYTP